MAIAYIRRALDDSDPLIVAKGFVALQFEPPSLHRDHLDAHLRQKLFKLSMKAPDGDIIRNVYQYFLVGLNANGSASRPRNQAIAELYLALVRPAFAMSPSLALIIAETAESLAKKGSRTFKFAHAAAAFAAAVVRREHPETKRASSSLGKVDALGSKAPQAALVRRAQRIRRQARLHGSDIEPDLPL